MRMSVEATNSGLRVRSRYSRRATIAAFGQERVAAGHQAAPSTIVRSPALRRRSASGRVLIGRPTDEVDEDRLERRVGDLEAGHPRAARDGRRDDRRRVGVGAELELGEAGPGSGGHDPGQVDQPRRQRLAVDAEADGPGAARPLQLAERAGGHDPPVVDDGQRLAQGLGRLHLVGREDDRPALVAQLEEGLAQEGQVDRVEPGERLVHEQHVRPMEDGRDELDLLLVALAQLLGPPFGVVGDAEARPASGGHPRGPGRPGRPYRLAK